jgi:hypothetical protein
MGQVFVWMDQDRRHLKLSGSSIPHMVYPPPAILDVPTRIKKAADVIPRPFE